jgi:UDP-N-acetylmuramyl pentapeptide phosphotransferase/UDP-N-acetylglucosamine-1-phosphate transferase
VIFIFGDIDISSEIFTLIALFAGALMGFRVVNQVEKVFMGDSGSYLTGFVYLLFR